MLGRGRSELQGPQWDMLLPVLPDLCLFKGLRCDRDVVTETNMGKRPLSRKTSQTLWIILKPWITLGWKEIQT